MKTEAIQVGEEEKVDSADQKEPGKATRVVAHEFTVHADRFAERFVMQRERYLHRRESDD